MSNEIETPDKYWAGGFLFDRLNNRVLLHQRDGNTNFNPFKWAFFGGLNEEEDNDPKGCFVRELHEEIGLKVDPDDVILLCEYHNTELNTYRIVFFLESEVELKDLRLGEGAGFDWVPIESLGKYDLTDKTREDMDRFIQHIGS